MFDQNSAIKLDWNILGLLLQLKTYFELLYAYVGHLDQQTMGPVP